MHRLVYDTINDSPYVTGRPPRLLEQIAATAEAGFDGIGIDAWSIDRHRELGGTLAELRDALDHHRLPCLELQAFVVVRDAAETRANAENIAAIAEVLRPEIIMSGTPEVVDDAIIDAFARHAPQVTASGARLAVEFLPTFPINSIAKARALLAHAGLPRSMAGVCLDVWHFSHGPDDWTDLAKLPVEDLAYVQFSDHAELESDDLTHEMMERRALPGTGILPLERFVETIRRKGYEGPVAAEVISAELRSLPPREAARRVFQATKPYWK